MNVSMIGLNRIIESYCIERQARDTLSRNAIPKFRMSDAGKCRLMRYWKRQGKASTVTLAGDVLRNMQAGIVVHEFLGQVIAAYSLNYGGTQLEGELQDEHRIGHYDVLVQTVNGSILYDIKTVKGKEAGYLEKYAKEAKHQHKYQIVTYASMLSRPDELRVVYVDRETLRVVREFSVDYDMLIKDVNEDWDILLEAWQSQAAPEANPDDSWECKFCMYKNDCSYAAEANIV